MGNTARSAIRSQGRLSKVMVTGVGGAAGFGLIKTLRKKRDTSVVALDCDPLASGLHLPGVEAHLTLPTSDSRYFAQLSELAETTAATALVPTLDEELMVLASRGMSYRDWDSRPGFQAPPPSKNVWTNSSSPKY